MKKLITLLVCVMLLTGCSSGVPSIEYNKTELTYINKHAGEQATVVGYMAVSSPTDGSLIYLMDVPLCASALSKESDTLVTDTIICYPLTGNQLKFTEKCVKMTGTISVDGSRWCLRDCSYEVYEPNEDVQGYHKAVDNGIMKALDDWLYAIVNGMSDKKTAKEVASATYETEILKNLDDMNWSLSVIVDEMIALTSVYNEWVKSGSDDVSKVQESYSKVQKSTVEWLNALRVTGGVSNETQGR